MNGKKFILSINNHICVLVFVLLSLIGTTAEAQRLLSTVKEKPFAWGGTIGLNASFPIINDITMNGNKEEEARLQYHVGYEFSLFGRISMRRIYLQPSITWQRTEGEIHFEENNCVNYRLTNLEVPFFIGYYLVKEQPYSLSVKAGPLFRYNYKQHYEATLSSAYGTFQNQNSPYGIDLAGGIGVCIGPLFFDFKYVFGLNETVSHFNTLYTENEQSQNGELIIHQRTNSLRFSLGFLF